MSRLLGIAAIYILMFLGWTVAGAFLLLAPMRAGNLIHESFGLFPEVARKDWGKKLFLRVMGAALLTFAGRFALAILPLTGSGNP